MGSARAAVLVGVAHVDQRPAELSEACEPLALMERALRAAAEDAGSRELLARADRAYVVRGVWPYRSPAGVLLDRIGGRARTFATPWGGHMVQACGSHAARAISMGECEVAWIAGAEIGHSQARARAAGRALTYQEAPGSSDAWVQDEVPLSCEAELARGIARPVQLYPVFENALRARLGESLGAQSTRISELWARHSEVAAGNPDAWIRTRLSAEEIREISPQNRMIGFPYPKRMNANSSVDQGGALLLCSVEAARRLGVPEPRWVYLHGGSEAHDTPYVSQRAELHAAPALGIAGRRLLELCERPISGIAHMDVYSCFPSAVEIALRELAIPRERCPTVTGGLSFAGGPLNSYVLHSIVTLVRRLREDPGSFGLITANGGFLTKHAFGLYSAEPTDRFVYARPQDEVDRLPRCEVAVQAQGPATLESYTVMHGHEGPEVAHIACRLPDGRRTWANSADPELMGALMREELCGTAVQLDGAGGLRLARGGRLDPSLDPSLDPRSELRRPRGAR